MPTVKHKAFAYITNAGRLLVFRQPLSAEAGIQVPAGTIRAGEAPEAAVMREAFEETGLRGLVLAGLLGVRCDDMSKFGLDELHRRHFFHLHCPGAPPERWRHHESDPADGSRQPIPFDFFWARLPGESPALIAGHDALIPRLLEMLGARGELDG
ncbi:MAG TPA: NUDIX domain-containing protein [Thermomicrobiaceae bacterium]|nr:NUDIX domain-containing protein [Thermomicrobiaceae bacterium]HEX5505904.1 NUDIX domain-containing protein [Thermomicrobiales bacterium]